MRGTALALSATLILAASAQAGIRSARESLNRKDYSAALTEYSRLRLTKSPDTAAEYAYALSQAGFKDLALGHLDQALVLQDNNPSANAAVNYFAAGVFEAAGQKDVADELAAQGRRPAWLTEQASSAAAAEPAAAKSSLEDDLLVANTLLAQRRFYTAVDRFQKLATDHPSNAKVYAAYAVALEKIGAYRKAARAVARAVELEGAAMPPERKEIFATHQQELETRAQEPPLVLPLAQKANLTLKGRYLVFLGGNINRNKANTVSNLNARLGKFFTNRFDASVTAGYTGGNIPDDYRGVSFGLAGRYHQPLPVPAPLNATFGSRVDYQPRPSKKTSMVVSPGLSWVTESGSFDVFYEYGVSGRLKEAGTISVGFTSYIGRSKK